MTNHIGKIRTAFLLAAGLGVRLKPLTDELPKPLLPLGGKPTITYAMERLAQMGIRHFIVNTHHLAQAYQRAFPSGEWQGIPITFVHEELLLDTAGGLKNIEALIADEENILVHNADIVSTMPLEKLLESHLANKALATLALRSHGALLNVALAPSGFILDIRFALGVRSVPFYQFSGIYIVRRSLLDYIPLGVPHSLADTLTHLIGTRPCSVAGVVIDEGIWSDIGTKEEYTRLAKEYEENAI